MAGATIPDETKTKIAGYLSAGRSKADVARTLGIDRFTVAKYAKRAEEPPITQAGVLFSSVLARPDLAAIVAAVLKQLEGNPSGKPEVVEQAPIPFPVHPQTRCVDLAGKKYERTAFISDLHCPFQDKTAVSVVCKAVRDYKPNLLVLGGDGLDFYSISDHDKEPGRCDFLQDEFDSAAPTWQEIDEAAGGADVLWVDGNHEYRMTRALHRNPGLFKLRSLELPIAAALPKRWQYFANQTMFNIGPLSMLHGDVRGRGNSVKHAGFGMLSKLRRACLFGHLHRFQTYYETGSDGTVRAGFANGHLCDVTQARYITFPDWQSGFSTIDYDWSVGVFSVTPHLIVRNNLRWGGVTYSA
jgi:predicted phosphodiesterase